MIGRTLPLMTCLAAACVTVSHADAGTIRHDRDDSLYTGLASDPAYQSVGRLTWTEAGSAFSASGTLIDSRWVLTAAHVIDGADLVGGGISNLTFDIDGQALQAAEWVPHPQWAVNGGSTFAGWDIGLIRLTDHVTGTVPAPLYDQTDELGQAATMVGFGATGDGLTGLDLGSGGTRRAGQNVIDVTGAPVFSTDNLMAIDFDNPLNPLDSTFGSTSPLNLEYLIGPGDSGGGSFLDIGGVAHVAGVHSFFSQSDGLLDGDYGDRAGITRVSMFIDWITQTAGLDQNTLPGDANNDGQVTGADLISVQQNFGNTGAADGLLFGDANDDGQVTGADLISVQQNFGNVVAPTGATVPEPAMAALLGVSGLLMSRRRVA